MKLVMAGFLGMLFLGNCAAVAQEEQDAAQAPEVKSVPKAGARADKGNPYSAILERNLFGLVQPPPPPKTVSSEEENATSTIKLTGFIRSTGEPLQALFVYTPKMANPTNAFYSLSEGERAGGLELLKIHEEEESADVIHFGVKVTLTLRDSKSSGAQPPGGARGKAPPGASPGAQAAAARALVQPGAQPGGAAAQPPSPDQSGEFSGGGIIVSGGVPQSMPAQPPQAVQAGQIPVRTIRTPQPAQPGSQVAPFIPGQQ